MKIAFFHELIEYSGARKVVDEYGRVLSKNHSLDLYYVDSKANKIEENIFRNSYFFRFLEKEWSGDNWKNKLYKDTFELIKLYFLHRKIANLIDSGKYDFVFVSPSRFTQAPFILRFLKTKSVYYCQEPLRIVYEKFFTVPEKLPLYKQIYEKSNRKLRKAIDRKNLIKSGLILTNSKFSKNNIKNAYNKKSFVCYLGVDVKKFSHRNTGKGADILFLGGKKDNIEGYGLLEKTLYLFNVKPRVKLIAGRDEGRPIKEEKLIKEYNRSKTVVCLSVNEPFGLTAVEAMSCGVPVIAIREGGFKETVVDNKTGFLVKRDPKELKIRLEMLLNNRGLRRKMGAIARNYVIKNFTWDISAESFMKTIGRELFNNHEE